MNSGDSHLAIEVVAAPLAIVRLAADAQPPSWLERSTWCSVTRTPTECSVVCEAHVVPRDAHPVGPWRALKVVGTLDFSLTGILYRIARPLAEAKISIFAVSTYDTDYVLVRDVDLEEAAARLEAVGIVVRTAD